MLAGVSDKAARLIKSMQPFSTGKEVECELWHINQLSNFDKHRRVHLTGALLESFKVPLPPALSPGRFEEVNVSCKGPFEHDTEFLSVRFIEKDGPIFNLDDVKVHAQLARNVAFDECTPAVGGWLVRDTLFHAANRRRSLERSPVSQLVWDQGCGVVPTCSVARRWPEALAVNMADCAS